MNQDLTNRVARMFTTGSKPTISRTEALRRVAAIGETKAFQASGFAGLKASTKTELETLLAYIGALK